MTNTQAPRKRRIIWIIAALILIVGVGGYIASKAGLDKALVKQALDHFAGNLENSTKDSPAQMSFSYDDVRITGGFSNRHAVILNPRFREMNKGTQALTLYRTAEAVVHPKSADLRSLRIELAKPLMIFSDEKAEHAVATIIQKDAIVIDVTPETKAGKAYVTTKVSLPDAFLIDGPADKASDPWNKLSLTLAPGAVMTNSMPEGEHSWTSPGEASFHARDIVLTPDAKPEDAITLGVVDTYFSNVLNDKNLNTLLVKMDVGPLASSKSMLPYGPLSANVDFAFEGALERSPEAFAEAKSTDSSIMLKTFSLKGKDAALSATADFVASASDMLPVGTANITVENLEFILAELRKRGALRERDDHLLTTVIERVSGKPMAENKDLKIDITRVRDGAFKIGKSTFEEIMAAVLSGALSDKFDAPAKDAPKPKTKPIPAPSTQG